ncbi:MAG: HK97 family phage prohead protease [Pseudomonadota bacterium]
MDQEQLRKVACFPLSIKEMDDDSGSFVFEGYASTFGNADLDGDIIQRGAFEKSILQARARAQETGKRKLLPVLYQHDMRSPIGVFTDMREDEKGLFVRGELPKDDDLVKGRVMPQMRAGSISDMSIGFMIRADDMDGRNRVIREAELFEISLVTIPANPQANVTGFKTLSVDTIDKMDSRELERTLREGRPLSQKAAAKVVSALKSLRRDGEGGPRDEDEAVKSLIAKITQTRKAMETDHASR